jgi:hypothetical protein
MNYTAVLKSIQDSNGASYNLHSGILNPSTGFMVATQSNEQIYDVPTTTSDLYNYVVDYLIAKKMWWKVQQNPDNIYLGFWINEGKLYIDLAENIPDRDDAIEAGHYRNQLAIYDCESKQDITLNKKVLA